MEHQNGGLDAVLASLKRAGQGQEGRRQVREALQQAISVARRAEAAKTVQGFFGSSIISLLDQVLQVATPVVAIYGDFELSNLLGSLKVWLDKKKLEEQEDQLRRDRMMSQSVDDLNFTYQM